MLIKLGYISEYVFRGWGVTPAFCLPPKCETRALSASECEPHIFDPKHETSVLPISELETCISGPQREISVLKQDQLTLDICISTPREAHVSQRSAKPRLEWYVFFKTYNVKKPLPLGVRD